MRLVCPNCGKAHIVRPEALGSSGRTVRCAACKTMWAVSARGEPVQNQRRGAVAANSHHFVENIRNAAESIPSPARPQRKRPQSKGFAMKMEPGAAILGALMLLLGALLFFREPVVETVPRLAGLYQMMGFDINVRGLEFADIKINHGSDNGQPILTIEGRITNVTKDKVDVPPVRITLRSPTGSEIDTVMVKAETLALEKSGETIFKSRLANPPQDAKDVLVKFSSTGLHAGG